MQRKQRLGTLCVERSILTYRWRSKSLNGKSATWDAYKINYDMKTRKSMLRFQNGYIRLGNQRTEMKENAIFYCTKNKNELNCNILVIAIYICLFLFCVLLFFFSSLLFIHLLFRLFHFSMIQFSDFISLTTASIISAFECFLYIYIVETELMFISVHLYIYLCIFLFTVK